MNSHKERFIQIHDRLITENPGANPDDLASEAYDRLRDDAAEAADNERKRRREEA